MGCDRLILTLQANKVQAAPAHGRWLEMSSAGYLKFPGETGYRVGRAKGDPTMADIPAAIAELDQQIAILRQNLRDLVEQAAAYSGGADEELASQRIAEQQEQLDLLTKRRDELARRKS